MCGPTMTGFFHVCSSLCVHVCLIIYKHRSTITFFPILPPYPGSPFIPFSPSLPFPPYYTMYHCVTIQTTQSSIYAYVRKHALQNKLTHILSHTSTYIRTQSTCTYDYLYQVYTIPQHTLMYFDLMGKVTQYSVPALQGKFYSI